MFCELFIELPGIVFLAKEKQNIIGVMRMKSREGRKVADAPKNEKMKMILDGASLYGIRSGAVTIP